MFNILNENTIYSNKEEYLELLNNKEKISNILIFNLFGFISLFATSPRPLVKSWKNREGQIRVERITDQNTDVSIAIKLANDSKMLPRSTIDKLTRLLALFKQGRISNSSDIKNELIYELFLLCKFDTVNKPSMKLRSIVDAYINEEYDIKFLAKHLYKYSKMKEFKGISEEFFEMYKKGQYLQIYKLIEDGVDVNDVTNTGIEEIINAIDVKSLESKETVENILAADKLDLTVRDDIYKVAEIKNVDDVAEVIEKSNFNINQAIESKENLIYYFVNTYLKVKENINPFHSVNEYVKLINKKVEENKITAPDFMPIITDGKKYDYIKVSGGNEVYDALVNISIRDILTRVSSKEFSSAFIDILVSFRNEIQSTSKEYVKLANDFSTDLDYDDIVYKFLVSNKNLRELYEKTKILYKVFNYTHGEKVQISKYFEVLRFFDESGISLPHDFNDYIDDEFEEISSDINIGLYDSFLVFKRGMPNQPYLLCLLDEKYRDVIYPIVASSGNVIRLTTIDEISQLGLVTGSELVHILYDYSNKLNGRGLDAQLVKGYLENEEDELEIKMFIESLFEKFYIESKSLSIDTAVNIVVDKFISDRKDYECTQLYIREVTRYSDIEKNRIRNYSAFVDILFTNPSFLRIALSQMLELDRIVKNNKDSFVRNSLVIENNIVDFLESSKTKAITSGRYPFVFRGFNFGRNLLKHMENEGISVNYKFVEEYEEDYIANVDDPEILSYAIHTISTGDSNHLLYKLMRHLLDSGKSTPKEIVECIKENTYNSLSVEGLIELYEQYPEMLDYHVFDGANPYYYSIDNNKTSLTRRTFDWQDKDDESIADKFIKMKVRRDRENKPKLTIEDLNSSENHNIATAILCYGIDLSDYIDFTPSTNFNSDSLLKSVEDDEVTPELLTINDILNNPKKYSFDDIEKAANIQIVDSDENSFFDNLNKKIEKMFTMIYEENDYETLMNLSPDLRFKVFSSVIFKNYEDIIRDKSQMVKSVLDRSSFDVDVDFEVDDNTLIKLAKINGVGVNSLYNYDFSKFESKEDFSESVNSLIESNFVEEIENKKVMAVTDIIEDFEKLKESNIELYETSNGMHGDVAPIILKSYEIDMDKTKFEKFVENDKLNPKSDSKGQIKTMMFHGTGSVAVSFISKFGFREIPYGAGIQIAGKMLGGGIYLAENIDKSLSYIGDGGFEKSYKEGYVFIVDVCLGEYGIDYIDARDHGVLSPEWCIKNFEEQILVKKIYKVKSTTIQEYQDYIKS